MTVEEDTKLEVLEKIIFECLGVNRFKMSGRKHKNINKPNHKSTRRIEFHFPNSSIGYFNIGITEIKLWVSYSYSVSVDAIRLFNKDYLNKLPETHREEDEYDHDLNIRLFYEWGLDNPNMFEESKPIIDTLMDFMEDPYLDYIR